MNKSKVPLKVKPGIWIPMMNDDIIKMGNKFIFLCEVDVTKPSDEHVRFNITSYTFATPAMLEEIHSKSGVIGIRSYLYSMYQRLLEQIAGRA